MNEQEKEIRIGKKIRQLRELKDYSQEYMAEKLGMSVPGYSRIERNEVDVNIEKAYQIASILNVGINDLLNFDEKYIFHNYNYGSDAEHAFVINSHIQSQNKEDRKTINDLIQFLKDQIKEKDIIINNLLNKK
ncbi:helix-turn-helix transcriptional regulator [Crocinitomicaceae bacterium CZZ-1]|uniref:Helix-turn-helix transcriptional regulator n=1 Tax=Taishania pollutisoli TaxID=2766479 RepID=A0A8J6PLD8_9FLAO|nr:helix-turn-helix transcriptional regulator [Taishania pollutisoli]MBC9813911.1 helix-turn-helix transcriptional regulator [Taishania pollutisoli]